MLGWVIKALGTRSRSIFKWLGGALADTCGDVVGVSRAAVNSFVLWWNLCVCELVFGSLWNFGSFTASEDIYSVKVALSGSAQN